jgi:hypothetical protein
MGAFDAAAYCASISAAKRRKSQCEGVGAVMLGADGKHGSGADPLLQDQGQQQQQQQQAGAAHVDAASRGVSRGSGSSSSGSGGSGRSRPCAAGHSRLLASTRTLFRKLAFWAN